MLGQAIYESFANGDVRGLMQSGVATQILVHNYEFRAPELVRLSTAMERAWQGEAAGAAGRGASPLIMRHLLTAPHINTAATSIRQQMDAYLAAKQSVVPVPPVPDRPDFLRQMFTFGGAGRDYEKQITAVQNANDHNVAVMTRYENATRQNASLLAEIPPALQKLPPLREDHLQESSGPRPSMPSRIARPGGGRPAGAPPDSTTTPPRPQFPTDSPGTDSDLGQTRPESVGTTPSKVTTPDVGSSRPAPVPSPEGPRSGPPFGPIGVGYGPGADPARRATPGGARGTGSFGGPRESGAPGGPRGGEPGARGGGASGLGARGATVAEGAVGRGTTGRAGAPGAGGPVGGARRGESEEDYEHQRPAFLVEADPDELFGNDEPAAPPVIGG